MASEGKRGGWVFFAGAMMILVGAWDMIEGILGLVKGDEMPFDTQAVIGSVTTWSWVHVAFGLVLILTGFGILNVSPWARMVGIVVVGLNLLGRMVTVHHNPVWSMMLILMDVVIIYALCVYHDSYAESASP